MVVHSDRLFGSSICVRSGADVLAGGCSGQVELQPIRLVLLNFCDFRILF